MRRRGGNSWAWGMLALDAGRGRVGRVVSEGGAWAGINSHSAFLDKIKDALDAESCLARLAVTPSCNEMMESADSAWQRKGASGASDQHCIMGVAFTGRAC